MVCANAGEGCGQPGAAGARCEGGDGLHRLLANEPWTTELDAAVGTADTPAQLAQGLRELPAGTADVDAAQRALDVQDGWLLHLLRIAYKSFRNAHVLDGTIRLLPTGNVRRAFLGAHKHAKTAPADPTTTTPPAAGI